ncbi:ankyrin repeat domain-containing protein [Streptomyces sp. SudanB25_2051]|uniref:ankyrin repeat domain-containing protein n=1 Tax=Streptomyces sp. SudanB25_2051 TaxID=3035275 RepID=UPI003F555E29
MTLPPPDEASSWRRARRHAVPRWMIERATAHRLAGDWAAACATAHVDVAFDPAAVARRHGAGTAAALLDDLRHLAPDLLRWHLPRVLGGRTTLATGIDVVIAAYGTPGPCLYVTTPRMRSGPQRLTLRFGAPRGPLPRRPALTHDWTTARHLWDARHADDLRERVGGGPDRAPFCHPDGTLRTARELPAADPGPGDPAGRSEWIDLAFHAGDYEGAFTAAGIDYDPTPPRTRYRPAPTSPRALLGSRHMDVARVAAEVRRLAAHGRGERFLIPLGWQTVLLFEPSGPGADAEVRISEAVREDVDGVPELAEAHWRRLPDLDLLRGGGVAPRELHPLVTRSLFPALDAGESRPEPAYGPPGPCPPPPVRVRCRGEWHEVSFRDGALRMPHTEDEQRRERALSAFGGAVTGCFAVQRAWTSRGFRLPRALDALRKELFLRAQHGDTPGVTALLDAGLDPHVRHADGRTLLHVLNLMDHEELLPRLLAAGVNLEARDALGRTPLFTAVNDRGSRALVDALLAAGARVDVLDHQQRSLAHLVRIYGRRDLRFLRERVQRDHPGLGSAWWEEYGGVDAEPQDDETGPSGRTGPFAETGPFDGPHPSGGSHPSRGSHLPGGSGGDDVKDEA